MRRPAKRETEDQFARIAPHYDALMANVPYGVWAEYVAKLAALSGRPISSSSNLLDLATGTGSVALQFAARGCRATGIDASAPMIEQAKRKASLQGHDVRFICADLASFRLPPEFDHAVCLYDSLNYILDPDHLKRAFANTKAALRPQGLFIFDVNTVHALEAELFTQKSPPTALVSYRWKSKYDPKTRISRIRMSFQIAATGEKFTLIHRQRSYTDAEIRSFLFHGGFADVATYDAYTTDQPGPQSDRVFYVAKTPAD